MTRIGVLGGGQLSRFLILEGLKQGLQMRAYCQSESDPAYPLHRENQLGGFEDRAGLQKFYESCDLVTFESEFVDPEILRTVCGGPDKTLPGLEPLKLLRDRKTQKSLLVEYGLPHNPTISLSSPEDFWRVFASVPMGLVAKQRTHGYDGYGTSLIKDRQSAETFIVQQGGSLENFIFEPFLKFKRELAVMAYRTRAGQTGSLPWVEWKAKDAKCWWVKGPVDGKALQRFITSCERFLRKLEYVGVMAFECFELASGLLLNEIAPRVHNSMHHSLDSLPMSQFALHLACLRGEKIPPMGSLYRGFAMVNLLGSNPARTVDLSAHKDGKLYWYGKQENRSGRKMGHINAVGASAETALKVALKGARQCQL